MRKRKGIADELRFEISRAERRGMTKYQIAKLAKMPRSMLTRIASGETIPTLDTAERIAGAIELRLTIVPIVAK